MKKSEREKMTVSQFVVLKYINLGYKTKEIALILGIKPSTVSVHRKNLFKRIGVHSVWDVVQYCRKHRVK